MNSSFIVIVNYKTDKLVVDCLQSLAPEIAHLNGGRVIVVDNASGNNSFERLQSAVFQSGWGDWVETVALPKNGGFAYGNNRAIERVREINPAFGFVVLLNPDTVVRPGALAALFAHLAASPSAGIAGASIEDEHGVCQQSAHPFPSVLGELTGAAQLGILSRWLQPTAHTYSPEPGRHAPDWVSGACLAVRREVLDTVGPLDEGFFLYFEETDFCYRAKQAGWSCTLVPEARVMHFEGAATGIKDAKRRLPGYWFDSRRRFFVKTYGIAGWLVADLLWTIGRFSLVTRRALRLGGRQSESCEPIRVCRDLLASDLRALVSGAVLDARRVH
jgi:N-acetylglucosaminyl-diphospho-decaprenol L-rhamnosyltransferase